MLESGVRGPSPGHVADLLCVPEGLTAPLSSPTETGRGTYLKAGPNKKEQC